MDRRALILLLLTGCSDDMIGLPHVNTTELPPGYSLQYNPETKHFGFCMPHYCPRNIRLTSQEDAIDWAWFQYTPPGKAPKPSLDDDEANWRTVKP